MLILGLTGGIASGKLTVSQQLATHYPVIDADQIARDVVAPGTRGLRQIAALFSDCEDLLQEDGLLNRAALGRHVFGNKERLATLNSITHPAVRREMVWQMVRAWALGAAVVVLDVPLLFEAGMHRLCGKVVVVAADEQTQVARLALRNPELSREDCVKRVASQMPTEDKCAMADIVVDNMGSREDLARKVDQLVADVRPAAWLTVLEWIPFVQMAVEWARARRRSKL